jgi:hypothetical protein
MNQYADDVLEIANNLQANRLYHLLPFGLVNGRLPQVSTGDHSSLIAPQRFRNSTHLGAGRSPPQ